MDLQKNWRVGNVFLKEAFTLSGEILNSLENKKPQFPIQQSVFFDFAVRAHCCLTATHVLWLQFPEKTFFKFPIAIQLRVGVLDFITFLYLFEYRKNESEFQQEVDRLNQQFYSWMSGHAENYSDEVKPRFEAFLKDHFPLKYDEAGNKVKVKSHIASQMVEDAKDGELSEYVNTSYNIYRLLSQYEHYSEVSRKFMLRPADVDVEEFMVAIDCVLLLQYFSFQLLGVDAALFKRYEALYNNYVSNYGDGQIVETKDMA